MGRPNRRTRTGQLLGKDDGAEPRVMDDPIDVFDCTRAVLGQSRGSGVNIVGRRSDRCWTVDVGGGWWSWLSVVGGPTVASEGSVGEGLDFAQRVGSGGVVDDLGRSVGSGVGDKFADLSGFTDPAGVGEFGAGAINEEPVAFGDVGAVALVNCEMLLAFGAVGGNAVQTGFGPGDAM